MTTKPTITLSNIKVHVGLSDETPAYTATILVDGVKFADVENNGTGGCDNYRPVSAAPGQQAVLWEKVKELDARIAATYDKIEAHGLDLTMDLETLCHTLVWEHVDQRNFLSALSRKVLAVRPDGNVVYFKGKKTDALLAAVRAKPGYQVLNDMPFEAAWAIMKTK